MEKGLPLLLILKCCAIHRILPLFLFLPWQSIYYIVRSPSRLSSSTKTSSFKRKKKETRSFLFSLFEDYIHRWAWGRQLGGGSAKFWPGGSGFWTPRGGTSSAFLRGERGGNKRRNQKIFLIATKRRQIFGHFEQK